MPRKNASNDKNASTPLDKPKNNDTSTASTTTINDTTINDTTDSINNTSSTTIPVENLSGIPTVLKYGILGLICLLAFSIRLFAVVRYESVIHEFDPYFNFR